MKTYSKIILSGVVLAAIGATAAVARNHGERGMGGPMGGEKMYARMCSADAPKMDGSKMADPNRRTETRFGRLAENHG